MIRRTQPCDTDEVVTIVKKLLDRLGPRVGVQTRCETLTLGTPYGSHTVCPSELNRASVVYSFGIGEDASFDVELIERFGMVVHAFDPTPKALDWVARAELPEQFEVVPVALGTTDGTLSFHLPKNPNHVSGSAVRHQNLNDGSFEVPAKKLATLMAERGHGRLDVLKLDIEGSEYGVLEQICAEGIDCRQLLVEFHHQFDTISYARTRECVERMNASGYRVFHVADNGREVSLIRS